MICMELENDKMNDVLPRRNERNEVTDKPINQYGKKLYRQQKYNNRYRVESWEHKHRGSRDVSLRNLYIDLLLNKRGIFIKSSNPEDYAKKCNSVEPRDEMRSVLAERLKYKRRQKELEQRKREILRAKAERREKLKKYSESKRERFTKLIGQTKNSQTVMKDNLDALLAKIQIDTQIIE